MKTRIALIALTGLLCGCDQERAQRQEKILEQRIAALEEKSAESEKRLADHISESKLAVGEMYTNVQSSLKAAQLAAEAAQLQNEQFTNFVAMLTMAVSNPPPRKYYQNQTATPAYRYTPTYTSAATKNGVPIDVYNQIAADSAAAWPGNYDMQEFRIKQQVEAYKKLHGSQ